MRANPLCVLVMIAVAVSAAAQTRNPTEQHQNLEQSLPGNLVPATKHSGKLVGRVRPRLLMPRASSFAPAIESFSSGSAVATQIQPEWKRGSRIRNRRPAADSSGPSDSYLATLQYFVNQPAEWLLLHRATVTHGKLNCTQHEGLAASHRRKIGTDLAIASATANGERSTLYPHNARCSK
jgi:hypothetical protein